MDKKSPSTHEPASQNARGYSDTGDDLWSSLPRSVGRHGARLITKAQFDSLATGPVGPHHDVTRFLTHPDFRVTHSGFVGDMTVIGVDESDGVFVCVCSTADGDVVRIALSDLWPAGPASDAMREVVSILMRAVTEDMVAQLIDAGALAKPDPADLPAVRTGHRTEGVGGGSMAMLRDDIAMVSDELLPGLGQVVHLGAHPEYVMEPGSTSTKPGTQIEKLVKAAAALVDEMQGDNDRPAVSNAWNSLRMALLAYRITPDTPDHLPLDGQ